MAGTGTYVYCLIAAKRRPVLRRARPGLPGAGRTRLLPVDTGRWLIVADAPLDRCGEAALSTRRLSNLDWVSRAAVAHEAVVESFIASTAVLPMKLFTIFTSDDRALEHIATERPQIDRLIARVARRDEWGVRVVLDRARAFRAATQETRGGSPTGASLPRAKKAARDATVELERRAKKVVRDVYGALGSRSDDARRRAVSELPSGGPLLLDAAFLVPRARAAKFRSAVGRQARTLGPAGLSDLPERPVAAVQFPARLIGMAKTRPARDRRSVANRVLDAPQTSVLDLLDHLLNKGVMANGDVTLGVAGIDLIYLRLSTLLCAADRVLPKAGEEILPVAPTRRPPLRLRRWRERNPARTRKTGPTSTARPARPARPARSSLAAAPVTAAELRAPST